jgi:hypothetical protein
MLEINNALVLDMTPIFSKIIHFEGYSISLSGFHN